MPLPVAYNDFLGQNGAFVNEGGPWSFTRSSGDLNCKTSESAWCRDVPHCLECYLYPSASLSSYTIAFSVNVSVSMNQYGNAESLDYDFSYQINWASSKTARGTPLTSTSIVGTTSFSDNFAADDHEELLHTRQTWVGDPFSHSGNTPVVKDEDQMGYIPLMVRLTFPREPSAYINTSMKSYKFRITTPTSVVEAPVASVPNSPSSNPSSPVSTSSSTSMSLSSVTTASLSSLPYTLALDAYTSQSSDSGWGPSVASSPSNNNRGPSNKVSKAAVAGGVMGAIALLSAFIIGFVLYRRRKLTLTEEKEKVIRIDADQQSFWVSPNSRPATNINVPANQHGVDPFVTPSHSPKPSGYAFDYGNGEAPMATRGDGPLSPQNSISQWAQDQNNAQSQSYNAKDSYVGINNHRRGPSAAPTTLTEAPPPAYIAPSALGIDVPPLPTIPSFGYGTTRVLPAPSVSESESLPASASQLGVTSTSGRVTFVAADAGLSQWARDNRSHITEKLEMKLGAAGYVPSDDPDHIDEEEWKREWGVTRLELTRMRALYTRTQAQI
ncbi:hypothetical protein FRC14_007551 [Serendipita sp. 396]|nr:hypothetical protein FRC14_007551 [Serendipita sp. 396]KAG8785005.1 hypothetical protein FRC15_002167 [Serendipita sp. 397]KAG8800693.1 hypothetical protein FRC16_002257 [Serendipita sp. 398]KAG8820037.1 hypothetical protein FRC19_009294 [Serendipita sp. 401]